MYLIRNHSSDVEPETVESFEIKLTSSSLLSVPDQRSSSPVTAGVMYCILNLSSSLPSSFLPFLLPSFSSLHADFDGTKVSLKAELFNSLSHVSQRGRCSYEAVICLRVKGSYCLFILQSNLWHHNLKKDSCHTILKYIFFYLYLLLKKKS